MNRNLARLQHWSLSNRLTINAQKTKYLLFRRSVRSKVKELVLHIGPTKLTECLNYDYLGFRLDVTLSFKDHVNNLVTNCNLRLMTLCKIRRYIDTPTAVRIYKSLIMSRLQYGLVFALNALQSDRKRLQTLQNRALRICTLSDHYVSNLSLHTDCKVLPISLRTKLDLLVLMYKKVRRLDSDTGVDENTQSGMMTRLRSAPTLSTSVPTCQRFRNSVTYIGPTSWEVLTPFLRQQDSLEDFRKLIKTKILVEFSVLQNI